MRTNVMSNKGFYYLKATKSQFIFSNIYNFHFTSFIDYVSSIISDENKFCFLTASTVSQLYRYFEKKCDISQYKNS